MLVLLTEFAKGSSTRLLTRRLRAREVISAVYCTYSTVSVAILGLDVRHDESSTV